MAAEEIELADLSTNGNNREALSWDTDLHDDLPGQLPPVDSGRQAWLFLAASFTMEALIWGWPFSFGLFQEYYTRFPQFSESRNIAVIGTCAMGIMYLDAPIVQAMCKRFPEWRRKMVVVGLFTMCIALGLSSMSKNVTHLILSQGILYAIGGSIAYYPMILFASEWFVKRRGLALGITWAGTGVSGVVLPLLLRWLLDSYGFRTTLRTWAVAFFVLTLPLLHYVKPRIPVSRSDRIHRRPRRLFNLTFVWTKEFLLLQIGNIIEALGFFLPSIWLPIYASRTLGSSPLASAFTVLILNTTSVFGCVLMGLCTDRYHVATCLLITTLPSTIAVFVLWGLANTLPVLYLFCAVYGVFAGCYTSSWPAFIRAIKSKHAATDPGMMFAFLAFGRGIGNVASGPLSEALVSGEPWRGKAGSGYGSGYGPLIVFTGVSALLGGMSFMGRRIGWL